MNTQEKMKILFYCLLFILLVSCSTKELRVEQKQIAEDIPDPAKPPEEFYTIGPGDLLEIAIWKEEALSGSVMVRPDGFITLPLVNEVQVVGLTTTQLRQMLEEKYKEFVNSPFATVRVTNIASSEIFLLGEVEKPGVYPVTGNDTILQLLTRAGGLTIFADRDDIHVIRREGDKVIEYTIDYDAIIDGDLEQDILLRPRDRIIVN